MFDLVVTIRSPVLSKKNNDQFARYILYIYVAHYFEQFKSDLV